MSQDLKKLQEVDFHSDQVLFFYSSSTHELTSGSSSVTCGYECSSSHVQEKDGGGKCMLSWAGLARLGAEPQ